MRSNHELEHLKYENIQNIFILHSHKLKREIKVFRNEINFHKIILVVLKKTVCCLIKAVAVVDEMRTT